MNAFDGRLRAALLSLVLSLSFSPSAALAAPADLAWVRVGLHEEAGGASIIISAEVSTRTALPAEVQLSVPKGAKVRWVGEILGDDPPHDPRSAFTTRSAGDHDLVAFTLTRARVGQIEAALPGAFVREEQVKTLKLDWVSGGDVARVEAGLIIPPHAQAATSSPGLESHLLSDHSTVHVARRQDLKAGDRVSVFVTYSDGEAAAASPVQRSGSGGSAGTLALLGAGILLAGGLFAVRRKSGPGAAAAGEPDPCAPEEASASSAEEPADARPETRASGARRRVDPRLVILAVPAIVLAALVFAVQGGPGATSQSQDAVTRVLGSAAGKATFETPVALDGELLHGSTHVFDALAPLPGLASATVRAPGVLVLTYDPAQVAEEQIAAALAQAGLTR